MPEIIMATQFGKQIIKDISGLFRLLTGMVPDSSQPMLERKYHDYRGNCFPIQNTVKTTVINFFNQDNVSYP